MSGILQELLAKTRLASSYLGPSKTELLIIREQLDVMPYRSGQLIVRVHSMTLSPEQTIEVDAVEVSPSLDDTQVFLADVPVMSVKVQSTNTPGQMLTSSSGDLPGMLLVRVVATQDRAGATALAAEISVDLLMREN